MGHRPSVRPERGIERALRPIAHGDEKHGPGLRSGRGSDEDYALAAVGHLVTALRGGLLESKDEESGLLHLEHAAARLLLLLDRLGDS